MADYRAQLLRKEDYRTTEWSGGTTTELSIAPEGSVYADRDFVWRLSSATVDVEESEFTALPDYNRIIMTLRGGIRLAHNKGDWLELPEFTPHFFDGGDETVSIGKVIDFNLMMRKGDCTGEAVPLIMNEQEEKLAGDCLSGDIQIFETALIYCYEGTLLLKRETGEQYRLETGDSLRLDGEFTGAVWSCKAETAVSAVIAAIHCC